MTNDSIGIDISKDNLDVYRLSDGRAARFANAATGFRDLARWLGTAMPTRLDLARDAERALAAIPGSIVRNWVEDHL